jgi:hypothetical protein
MQYAPAGVLPAGPGQGLEPLPQFDHKVARDRDYRVFLGFVVMEKTALADTGLPADLTDAGTAETVAEQQGTGGDPQPAYFFGICGSGHGLIY